ncbi:hypothetical protein ACFY3G_36035 [Streptomyces phaeochromogenes]|uniref:hypothetical protein n=1 Tax=Streptomyces phaeochromogenes TaxID=1923 RepID=UPI0036B40BB3
MAIHPSHIPVINEVSSPGQDELARHARLLATVEEAQTNGPGEPEELKGRRVDRPVGKSVDRPVERG